jgi:hypothetical protein
VKEEEASAVDFFYRGERDEHTADPRVSDDTPTANGPGGDVVR